MAWPHVAVFLCVFRDRRIVAVFLSPPARARGRGGGHTMILKIKKKFYYFFCTLGSEYARAPAYGIDRDRDSTVVGERTTLHPEYARVVSAHTIQVSKKNICPE